MHVLRHSRDRPIESRSAFNLIQLISPLHHVILLIDQLFPHIVFQEEAGRVTHPRSLNDDSWIFLRPILRDDIPLV